MFIQPERDQPGHGGPEQPQAFRVPERIPLFPLPNVVFFPKTYLPLHVFEPRYRDMVTDAAASGHTRAEFSTMTDDIRTVQGSWVMEEATTGCGQGDHRVC